MRTKFEIQEVVFLRCDDNDRDVVRILRNGPEQLLGCRLESPRAVDVDAEPVRVSESQISPLSPPYLRP